MSDQPLNPTRSVLDRLAEESRIQREARMPAERVLTKDEQDQLRASINQWIRSNGLAQGRLAAKLEISPTVCSQILSGSYRADPSKYLLMLDELTRTVELKDLVGPEHVGMVRISTVADMESVVEMARKIGTCALIWGPSGCGKTTYAKARALEKSTCVYVNLTGKGYTPSRLLRHIARDMRLIGNLLEYKNSPDLLHQRIVTALSGGSRAGRVVFIDNAHLLDKHGLWCLHSLHDASEATFVCIGQPALWQTVNNSRSDDGIGATVYARFGLKLNLTSATTARVDPTDPGRSFRPSRAWLHTPEDVKKFLDARKIKVHPGGVAWLHKLVNCPNFGGLHELDDIISVAERIYPSGVLTLDQLAMIDAVIRPPDDQKSMINKMGDLSPAVAAG